MFRLLYADGTTSAEANSIEEAVALYTGTLVAQMQQRRDVWVTISNDINGRQGNVIYSVSDVNVNSNVVQTSGSGFNSPVVNYQVASVDPSTGLVTYSTLPWEPSRLGSSIRGWWSPDSTFDALGWAPQQAGALLESGSLPTAETHNGRRVLRFAKASSQFLAGNFTRNQPTETWVAAAYVGATSGSNEVLFSGGVNNLRAAMLRLITNDTALRMASGVNLNATAAAPLPDRWTVFRAVFNGTSSQLYDGGTLIAEGNAGAAEAVGLALGAHGTGVSFSNCLIGEALVTDPLSANDAAELQNYLEWVLAA